MSDPEYITLRIGRSNGKPMDLVTCGAVVATLMGLRYAVKEVSSVPEFKLWQDMPSLTPMACTISDAPPVVKVTAPGTGEPFELQSDRGTLTFVNPFLPTAPVQLGRTDVKDIESLIVLLVRLGLEPGAFGMLGPVNHG